VFQNPWLVAAGILSAAAALAHLGVILGGARWYAVFGAGRRMVEMAERGSPVATLITLAIAAVLAIWAAFAFSGAGLIPTLPLTRWALAAITAVYLIRAVGFIPLFAVRSWPVGAFAWWSSAIVLIFGIVHLIGTIQLWSGR